MSNYRQSSVIGEKWVRCNRVTIVNNYMQTPRAIFSEETIVTLDDASYTKVGTNRDLTADFNSENGTIPLINPDTGEYTNTSISHAELYTILYSLYIQQALLRDNVPEPTL